MNLEILKKTRKKTVPGDIFAFKPKGSPFMFGRTVTTDALLGGCSCVLVYLYRATSPTKEKPPRLLPDELLIPPIGTNYQPWLKGYFETVAHVNPKENLLAQHCFYDSDRDMYFDESSRRLTTPTEPIGMFGLAGIQGIDILIHNALKK